MSSDSRFWVKRYKDEGWSPIPIPPGEKGPRISGWETADFDIDDFQEDTNVGTHLGRGGLYDVDLDCSEAIIAAEILLPQTNRISGRPSKPRSHWFYLVDDPITHVPYHGLGGANDTIVELRGFTKNATPTQTVIPPSLHPSGERHVWNEDGKPARVAKEWLERCVRNVAIAVLIGRAFPGAGNRHAPRLALAGFLKRAGVPDDEIREIGRAIMKMIGGDEGDWVDVCKTTLQKLNDDPNANVTGGPTLRDCLTDGVEVLRRLNRWLGREEIAAEDDVIDRLNKRFSIVSGDGQTVIADFEQSDRIVLMNFEMFRKLLIKETIPGRKKKDGSFSKPRPVADVWLEHPKGRQQAQIVYAPPGSPLVVGPNDYNGWAGFTTQPTAGEWPLIEQHLQKVLCADDGDLYDWFLNWSAALLQRPGRHATTSLVLMGGQGTGKGFVAHDLLGKMFHPRHYAHVGDRQQVYGSFNEVLSGKCLLFLDEATWGGDARENGIIKTMITSDRLLINRKHIPAMVEQSMLHVILASNEDWPVGLDRDDRRFTVFEVLNERANDPEYFRPLYSELENGGREAFLHVMLNWNIDEDLLRKTPNTQKKSQLKERSLPAIALWWQDVLDDGRLLHHHKDWEERVVKADLYRAYVQAMKETGQGRRHYERQFGKEIKRLCPSVKSVRTSPTSRRQYLFPSLDQTRREFQRFVGFKPVDDDA